MCVSVMCPGIRVQIKVGSQMLDNSLKRFSGFVLRALSDGYSVDDIDAVVGLGVEVINDEIAYLRRIGFLHDKNGLSISVSGQAFCNLLVAVEDANERGLDAFVEGFTGRIVPYIPARVVETEGEWVPVLENRTRINFLYSKDYGNATEFAVAQHRELFAPLSEEQRDSIYTQLEFERGPQQYMMLQLKELPSIEDIYEEETESIGLRRSVLQITYTVADEQLEEYRDILGILLQLRQRDGRLLSRIGWQLLDLYDLEQEANAQAEPFFYDNCSCRYVKQLPPKSDSAGFIIPLERQFAPDSAEWIHYGEPLFVHVASETVRHWLLAASNKVANRAAHQVTIEWEEHFYIQNIPYDLFWNDIQGEM